MDTSNREIAFTQRSVRWLLLLPWLAACTSDTVDLGGGEAPQGVARGSRCSDSTVVGDAVRVTNQAELDALAGCEDVTGDLVVDVFDGADLRPLASLRAVGGTLILGAYPEPPSALSDPYEDAVVKARVEAVVEAGYLASLEGVEALEQVGNLELDDIAAPSLAPFSNLRSVSTNQDGAYTGSLAIQRANNLLDLSGLENVRGISDLVLSENDKLQSLAGLSVGSALRQVAIVGSPELSDLEALALPIELDNLALHDLGIRNLNGMRNLSAVNDSLSLLDNEQLEDIDVLGQLIVAGKIFIQDNPKLARLPSLANLSPLEGLFIRGNTALTSIQLDLPAAQENMNVGGIQVDDGPRYLEITDNANVQSVALAAGLTSADYLAIQRNAALTSIELGSLSSLVAFSVRENESLRQVGLGALQTVNSLYVIDNPLLSTAALEAVRSFELSMRGNASDLTSP